MTSRRRRRHWKDLTHEEAIIRHAIRSVWDRRGVALSHDQYMDLCAACIAGGLPMEMRDHHGQPVYRVDVRGMAMFAVWSTEYARIVTFLPCREWVGNKKIKGKFVNMLDREAVA